MKQGRESFEVVKDNPTSDKKNYIFKNNKITRVGFYIILALLIIGIAMIFIFDK